MPVNYTNGKIYIIRSNHTENVYVGSTRVGLSQRMAQHRGDFKRNTGLSSGEVLKHGDAYIELIEAYPCNNREELCKREGEVMRATENCINKRIEGRTRKEYEDDNKVKIKQTKKRYRQDNKDKIKQYRDEHKDKTKQYQKQYRDEHKV